MAKLSHSDSRRMYSWWWDSHISPKNSKWLKENLTDMDAQVKGMIKLLEGDADSFARRAEMYYKKRPELMKLVEEFYRAYRALAERYDHATGVIRHAHRTMGEHFPNQDQMFADDSPISSLPGTDPRTLDGEFTDEYDSVSRRRSSKQFNNSFGHVDRVRKGLNFDEAEETEGKWSNGNNHIKDRNLSEADPASESEEIRCLKEALAKLEAEKEAGLAQYKQSLDRLSELESEVSKTQESFRLLNDSATKAENEVVILKEALAKLESEKEAKLYDYQKSLDRISDLQSIVASLQEDADKLDGRASSAETEVEAVKGELEKLSLEKDEALNQYMGSLDMISCLENKLRLTDEDAQRFRERAENAESEVETLKQTISKLNEEKEALDLQYNKCSKTISSLEQKLKSAEEEAKRLNLEIENGVSKLKGAEEQCLLLERSNRSLHSEMESLMLKMGTQTQELTEKQKELGRLWACVQEERLRFVEAETAFQTLQHLHAQTQEELRSMGSELQKRAQLLKVAESHTQNLQNEVVKVKEENKHLDEVNAASALSIKDMQTEISSLKDSRGKLEEEVELRTDQRNALQQEIYCLKEELNNLNQKHHLVLDQVEAVGLHPDSLRLSVQELQDKNSKLKETCHRESSEKAALLEKLVILEQLLEKNSILENSLSDLNAELEAVRGTIETLEQSCRSLLEEKSTLLDEKATLELQLQETSKSVETLSKNNTVLQNSLADALTQLEALKDKSKILEDSCQLLVCEKASLISEKDGINSELENTRIRLDDLGKIYGELEGRCATLEKEKESTLRKVEELQMSLDAERQEHASYVQISEARFTGLETEVHSLQRECQWRRKELDEVIDNVIYGEVEMFVLRRTSQELAENHLSILVDNEALLEEGSLSKKKILQLEKNNFEQEVEIRSLCDQASSLRVGASQLLKALDIFEDHVSNDETERDKANFMQLLSNIQILKESLCRAEEENQRRAVELMVLVSWVRQLSLDSKNLDLEKSDIERELKFRTEQLLASQGEVLTVLGMNENLKLKLREENCNKEALINQIEDLTWKLTCTQDTCQVLQREKLEITEEKKSLMDKLRLSEEKNNVLEEENYILHGEVVALDNLSLIFRSLANEKFMELRALDDNFNNIQGLNAAFLEKISLTEGKLQESELENIQLQERLQTSEDEMKTVVLIKDQLTHEIENGKEALHQMELELQEAEQKISLGETEKLELRNILDGFRTEHTEVKAVRDIQETQIFKLSADNDHLQSEMEMKINDINKLEAEAAMIFAQLQYSMVGHLLYEQKFYELQETCICCMDKNEELKSQLAAYGPEIVALEECISSLESHTIMHPKVQYPENEEVEGSKVTNAHKSIQNEDEKVPMSVTFSDLVDLRTRLQVVEKAAIEIKESMIEENMDLHTKLDASAKQLELLQSESRRYGRNWKPSSEIAEVECATLTKDIMLDQVSDGSCYGLSKRGPADIDHQTIESWETADPDSAIGLTVGKLKKVRTPSISDTCEIRRVSSMRKNKGEYPTSNKLKDLSMDKLDISKRFTEPLPEGNERKVLERLDSDVQKLANLQITVQDLKRKLGVTEKDKRGKAVIQCEALKGQLEEADMAIMKLFDLNGKLMRNVEDGSSFSEAKSSFDLEGDKSGRRRRVSEQARRMSEKIGRLQLEIQKLQFVLLKLDSESEGRAKMSESKRRVLLRDYLYGGARKGQRRKKSPFCACVEPSTVD